MKPSTKRKIRKLLAPFRRIGIKKKFSIISNNCWGGIVYDKFGLEYTTPTVGLLFKPNDFIKYVSRLDHYLLFTPIPIATRQIKENEHQGLYAAQLADITIFFIHYKNVEEAIQKYERRKKRIVKDNIIVKFCDITYDGEPATSEMLESICNLKYKKIVFTKNKEFAEKHNPAFYFKNVDDEGNIKNEFKQSNKICPLKRIKRIINE